MTEVATASVSLAATFTVYIISPHFVNTFFAFFLKFFSRECAACEKTPLKGEKAPGA